MPQPTVRFSQFNASLNRNADGQLVQDLSTPNNAQAKTIAETIQRVNPDVLLINEFDYVAADPLAPVKLFQQNYLGVSQNGAATVNYPYVYIAPSNTGVASGLDLDNNGQVVTNPALPGYGNDAFGFGNFPGQFGMVLLSKHPIDTANIRTFQTFLWKDMPGNLLTNDPTVDNPNTAVNENLNGYYSPEETAKLRLSSKSHWDVPILVDGQVIHALVSHPTPPVFDGPEDRNGKRNADEIRFWADYVTPGQGGYIYDDQGKKGGLSNNSSFVIMGDQNADPFDGDSYNNAILQLLQNPNINTNFIPTSPGGPEQAVLDGGINPRHRGNPAFDTADFGDTTPGNLRADYVLPSQDLAIANAAVFWPQTTDPLYRLVGDRQSFAATPGSDHSMVWADIEITPKAAKTVSDPQFIGQRVFPTGFIPTGAAGTINGQAVPVGGLSGLAFDPSKNVYYAVSDDRSENGPARFYTLTLDPKGAGTQFTNVTVLKNEKGEAYSRLSLDPEDIVLTNRGTVFISSEGEANATAGRVTDPFVNEYSMTGDLVRSLPVSQKFRPVFQDTNGSGVIDAGDTQVSGIRNNLAFESLTIAPNQRFLYTATENALFQDGPVAGATTGSRVRIVQYNLVTGQPEKEYLYETDPVAVLPPRPTSFNTNGLVDLLAIDDQGTFLAVERSFTADTAGTGATVNDTGNTIKIYEIKLQGATDISFYDSLTKLSPTQLAAIRPAEKRLVLNLDSLKLPTGTDNIEGIEFGPTLPDGRRSIVLVSDNNFSATQFTQILALGAEVSPVRPEVVNYEWNDRPKLGTTTDGQDIFLGGFSGLSFQGLAANGNLKFVTHTDRGPNGENSGSKRPFALPDFQPEIVTFELNQKTGVITITDRIAMKTADGKPITGLPNLQGNANGLAYTDEVPVDLAGKTLKNDTLGADTEGIVVDANGNYWLVDEYRPAIYQFDPTGKLIQRFVPEGTAAAGKQPAGTFGTEALPAVYAQRRSNRGFEAIALEGTKLYAFIQSPIDNPDSSGDTTSRGSRNLRILEFDVATQTVTGQYVYLLDNITGSGNARTDKLGDAVSLGNGKFAVVERDDRGTAAANKLIYQIDLKTATNINALPQLFNGKTIEQLTPAELTAAGIQPASKKLIVNAAQAGYTGVEKLEGLALIDENTLAILNDNDFGITGTQFNPDGSVKITVGDTPVKLALIDLPEDLPIAKSVFPNGVASGDTTQTSTVLWTKANQTGSLTFEYSTQADFSTIAGKQTTTVTDTLKPAKVDLTGLTPGTTYYYRAVDANGQSATGQFKTANALGTYGGFRMGVSGDWRGELAPYPAIANADDRNLDLFILNGDTIYSDYASPGLRNPDGSEKAQAQTLDDFRLKHAEVYGSRNGQNYWNDLRSKTSVLATVDDHEVVNDFEGGEDLTKAGAAQQRLYGASSGLVNDSPLFENGMQAFQEYNPLRDEFYGATGDARTAGERKLYRYNTFGSDAATFVLDTRSFRDSGLPAANLANPTEFLVNSFNPQRTMLGRPQLEDLKRDLLSAERDGITWKFITVPEPIQNLGVLAASDRFEGYAAERTEILKFIDDNKISNVVFVAADIHGTVVNNLTYQLAPGGQQIATSAFEISTGSVAFDAPFGQTVAELAAGLGLLTPAQKAFYDSLPIANDADDLPNDQDDFIKGIVNDGLRALGYDPVGLSNNLSQANGLINAKLLQGDYSATHTYGWTEFNIDAKTQKLVVTTYGIAPYTREELAANPGAILARQPKVVSQFEVDPKRPNAVGTVGDDTLFGTNGDDFINALGGNNIVYAGEGNNVIRAGSGNDIFYAGAGNDVLDAGNGNNTLYAGEGRNQITTGSGNDLIYAGAADDIINAGSGNNTIYAGEGRNQITTGSGNDLIYAGAADDLIAAGAGVNTIYAGEGNNTVTSTGLDTIYLGSGRDRLSFSAGAGEATVIGFGNNDVIQLGSGLKFSDLSVSQTGLDTVLSAGTDVLATLKWTQANSLTASRFV
jgi:phosphodiesterase/alkaline phosphatase D-like protein